MSDPEFVLKKTARFNPALLARVWLPESATVLTMDPERDGDITLYYRGIPTQNHDFRYLKAIPSGAPIPDGSLFVSTMARYSGSQRIVYHVFEVPVDEYLAWLDAMGRIEEAPDE